MYCANDKCIEPSKAMATSVAMPGRPRRFHCVGPCLLLCLAWLVLFDALRQLSFVHGTRPSQRQVTQRCSQKGRQLPVEQDEDSDAEARRLTSNLKKAYSAEKLIEVLDGAVDGPIFNFFHASASYTQLVRLKRKRDLQQKDWDSPVLLKLHARVEDIVLQDQLPAREMANVLWSIAQLSDRFSIPTQLLFALSKSVPTKVQGMDEQNLSNSLWACAKLKEVAPEVLKAVPAIVAQIPNRAKDMVPQHLSNCLWASAQLKDVAPFVLEAVPAIVAQIPDRAKDMVPQALSNCLLACAQLKDEVPKVLDIVPAIFGEIPVKLQNMKPQEMSNSLEALVLLRDSVPEVAGFLSAGGGMDDILRSAAKRLNCLLPRVEGKDLSMAVPVIVWACAKAQVYDGELLVSVSRQLDTKLSSLRGFNLCAVSWSYQVLDAEDVFEDFKTLLMSEAGRRGFSEADVESCQCGRFQWNQAS
eukprot:s243_g14.t1